MIRLTMAVFVFALCLAFLSAANAKIIDKAGTGKPAIKAINVLTFADEGILLIGDGAGSQIVAVDTGKEKTKPFSGTIKSLDKKLAARLGTTPKGISIIDLAADPATGAVYIAVRHQAERKYVIVKVTGKGNIEEFSLEKVRYAAVKLSAGKIRISRITDVAYADGRILAAGRGTGSFASKIFNINTPISNGGSGDIYSAETYHVSHRRWETRAPMSVLIPFKEDGKTYVVGAFSCTPVVKYPIDNIKSGAQVKGRSMIELGSGNRPIDMIVYKKDNKSYVLSNTYRFKKNLFGPSKYWTVRFEQSLLGGEKKINKEAVRRLKSGFKPATPRITQVEKYHSVTQMDKLDAKHAVVLRETLDGPQLEVLALP